MIKLQQKIISELGVKPNIDYAQEVETRLAFLLEYLKATHTKGLVLGISGGVDSTLGGRLCQLAVERARKQGLEVQFIAMRLPHLMQLDETDAQKALDFIRPDRVVTFNIGSTTTAFSAEYTNVIEKPLSDFTKGNTKARLRMVAQYALAGDENMLVVGTDHAAEAITGFYTKFGDGGADVMPLAGLNKRQIRGLVEFLGGDKLLANKVPTADLLDNKPARADEEELGVSYDNLDDYLEGKEVPFEIVNKIEQYFLRSQHKRTTPVTPQDSWWK